MTSPDRNHFIASVGNTLQLLEAFDGKAGPLPLMAFVEATGKPKSSVHRMLSTLTGLGFLEQDAKTSRYRLTLKLWRLGTAALAEFDVLKVSEPHLERLMRAADETVHLAILDPSGSVVYIAKVESPRSIRVQTRVGKLNPSWCTATGRSLLAFHPEVADAVLSGPLTAITQHTITDVKRIRTILSDVLRNGYTVAKCETHPEMGGVAAPIRDHTGGVIAACGVAVPAFRMDRALIEHCIPLVKDAAGAISVEMGYDPQPQRELRHGT
jgi:DNA-binding IclR family transcriptional regulator